MFERIKFARYALAFERAFKTDDWDRVRDYFLPDATYTIAGSGTAYDGETQGSDRIIAQFKDMLDRIDRRYDRRKPGFNGWPRVVDGELVFPWKATYTKNSESVTLHGVARCRFEGKKIARLQDTMHADECARWVALAEA